VSARLPLGKEVAISPFVSTFAECTRRHSTKVASLPSAEAITLGKEALPVPRCAFFAECYGLGTRQSTSLKSCIYLQPLHLFKEVATYPPFAPSTEDARRTNKGSSTK
jgi:hypothetical protein